MIEKVEMEAFATEEPKPMEDKLLAQIDAFREKAKQIQSITVAKERRVKELEAMVAAKEEQNTKLEQELNDKQAQADSIAAGVEAQLERIMASLKDSLAQQAAESQEQSKEQLAGMEEALKAAVESLDAIKQDISDKIHNENVLQYRNLQDLLKEMDHSEEDLEIITDRLDSISKKQIITMVFAILGFLTSTGALVIALLSVLQLI